MVLSSCELSSTCVSTSRTHQTIHFSFCRCHLWRKIRSLDNRDLEKGVRNSPSLCHDCSNLLRLVKERKKRRKKQKKKKKKKISFSFVTSSFQPPSY
jgi:hypothetical protein